MKLTVNKYIIQTPSSDIMVNSPVLVCLSGNGVKTVIKKKKKNDLFSTILLTYHVFHVHYKDRTMGDLTCHFVSL